ncbi:enoyl-CoA hydratase [Anaerobacillus alkaliphilus]|uniref:Enoyl-CoA hydratase n=1 Tax=Anaerobacillus alkaliphilus TaxID=1548597 RepID=A0A4Q0VPV4_9BACI|nr:MaoC/PaaZ C-terminal domain-containing protein [Anaerobacillus alkaliphilus]RXI98522.1 enoyl-CoA hydratase [Anaerobacillus alkaliphilus]
MMFNKKRRLGRKIQTIKVGEKLELTKKIEDKDILLYLGLTDDANPIFIQHDYASQTPFQKPIVPQIMLAGIITSAISKYLPGPGSSVLKQHLTFPKPLYHYGSLNLLLETIAVNESEHYVEIKVEGKDEFGTVVVEGIMGVCPPHELKSIAYNSGTFENF